MDDLISEFLAETNESLEVLDTEIVTLEQNPDDMEIIDNIFRVMHTIKGTCGFLGLPRLEAVAHASENVLDKIRDGSMSVNSAIISLILESIDQIKHLLDHLEEHQAEPEGDDAALIEKLNTCAETGAAPGAAEEAPAASAPETPEEAPAEAKTPDLDEEIDFEPVKAPWIGEEKAEEAADTPPETAEAASAEAPPEEAPVPEKTASAPEDISDDAKQAAIDEGLKASEDTPAAKKEKAPATQSIRVNLDVLENLMQMAGELVLTRNQLLQIHRKCAVADFSAPLQRLNHITSDLQEGVMKSRMQPIGTAWAKFPRLIRDLSVELNKKIDLEMEGADTELDRQLLEIIKDPLTHMVRNSVDHGLETPEERTAAGKSETGTVTLRSFHEGGHIIVQICDNGKGINVDAVKAKAIANGVASETEINTMSNKEIYQFIFKAGFSTAEKVTAVSGRGVGMDVVRSNIEKIGGSIELDSTPGKGSTFTIKIPLTLAIMPVLLVESAGEKFAIPQIRVSEIVRIAKKRSALNDNDEEKEEVTPTAPKPPPPAGIAGTTEENGETTPENSSESIGDKEAEPAASVPETKEENPPPTPEEEAESTEESQDYTIEMISNAPVMRLRENLLPLISLSKTLQLDTQGIDTALGFNPEESPFVVVCELGGWQFGLIVDKVYDTEEIVVKPMSRLLKELEVFSGITILGDGSVVMILDPNGIAKHFTSAARSNDSRQNTEGDDSFDQEQAVSFLLFKAGGKAKKAVPLELVSRLEEVNMTEVEWAENNRVVQYRGNLMRLIRADDSYELPEEGIKEVIVFVDEGKIMGLIVEEILDIVEEKMDIQSFSGKNGILGSMVMEGETCDLVDISHHFSNTFTDWLVNKDHLPEEEVTEHTKHILLVDDSPFFRKFMKPILVVAGYKVTLAEDAFKAQEILNKGIAFDAVITDIDMPGMSGIELAHKCRTDERFSGLPIIALTSYSSEEISKNAADGDFNGYVSKSDRDKLVDTITNVLAA